MKHLILLFGAIALVHIASAGQNGRKNVNFNEDGSITIHAANGKEITICKPGLTGQKRFEVIVTGPHMPRKRIYVEYPEEGDYSEMNYRTNPRNEEGERYKRSHKHYHELFVKILQPYEGYVNEEDYEKILKDVEKAVKKGDIHYVLLALLQSLVQEKLWNDLVKGQGMFMGSKTPAYDDVMYYGRPSYNYNTRPYYYEPYGYQSYKPGGYGGQGMYGNSPYGSYGASYPYYSSGGSSFPQMPRPLSSQSYIRPEVEHQVHLPVQRYTRGSFGAEVNAKEVDYRDSTSMFDHQIHPSHDMYHEIEPRVHYSTMHHMHPLEHPVHPRMMQGIRWNMDHDIHSNADSEIHSNVEHDHSKWDHSNLDHLNLDYSSMGRDLSSMGRDHSSIGRDHSNLEVNMHTYPEHGIHYVPEHGIHYNPEHGIHYNPEHGIHYTPEHRFHSGIHSSQEHAIRSNSNQDHDIYQEHVIRLNSNQEQDIHQERSPEQHSIHQEINPNEHRIWGHSAVHITQEKLEKNRHV